MIRRQMTAENALARLESLCARSEQCTYEVAEKLRRWGVSNSDSERIVDSLVERRFVDDARFARAFVNDKVKFGGYGRVRIRLALAAKRVARDIIDEAISGIDEAEYAARMEQILASRALRIADIDTFEGRTKLYRYGLSRGYESDLVSATMRKILKNRQ